MPDWKSLVRERLAPLRMKATAESALAEELAQHLEDHYRELRSGGASEEEAYQDAISELDDMYPLQAGLERDQQMPNLTIRLPEEKLRRVRRVATMRNKSANKLVEEALDELSQDDVIRSAGAVAKCVCGVRAVHVPQRPPVVAPIAPGVG